MSKILLLSKPSITNGLSTLLHSTKPPSPPPLKFSLPIFSPGPHSYSRPHARYSPIRALNTPPANEERDKLEDQAPPPPPEPENAGVEEYPSGEFEMIKFNWWVSFLVKLRMLFAFPWERVKKGSVLSIKLKGQVLTLTQLVNFFTCRALRRRK